MFLSLFLTEVNNTSWTNVAVYVRTEGALMKSTTLPAFECNRVLFSRFSRKTNVFSNDRLASKAEARDNA